MRALFRTSVAFATLLVAGPVVAAAAGDVPPPATPTCTYHDVKYSPGALICLAPQSMQKCNDKGVWEQSTEGGDFKQACAKGQIPAPGAPANPPGQCAYYNVQYGPGSVICVAPNLALTCESSKDGVWAASAEKECANAQIPAPAAPATSSTTPPGLCTYHDVHYATNAVICVAPRFGQTCKEGGGWSEITGGGAFEKACANAQIPAPSYPAAPAGAK